MTNENKARRDDDDDSDDTDADDDDDGWKDKIMEEVQQVMESVQNKVQEPDSIPIEVFKGVSKPMVEWLTSLFGLPAKQRRYQKNKVRN